MNKHETETTRIFWNEYEKDGVYRKGNDMIKCEDETQNYYLHNNLIAAYAVNDRVLSLYTQGYYTNATKSRLNALLESGGSGRKIYQEKGLWYIKGSHFDTVPFLEGMRIFI